MKAAITALLILGFCSLAPGVLSAETISNADGFADFAIMGIGPASGQEGARPGQTVFQRPAAKELSDKEAQVFDLRGTVRISRAGTQGWQPLQNGETIHEGDVLLTEQASTVSVTYDSGYMNVTHVPQNSRVIFRSIEPTDISVEDGTIYNLFDALPKEGEWKVTTPTAVAAVRGTWWLVHYTSASGEYFAATIEVSGDGEESKISLHDILPGGAEGKALDIPEGNQIQLKEGQAPDPSLLEKIDSKWLEQIWEFVEKLAKLRVEKGTLLPATAGEFDVPPTDPQSLGLLTNVAPVLDPVLDIGSVVALPTQSDPASSSSSDVQDSQDSFDGPSDGDL